MTSTVPFASLVGVFLTGGAFATLAAAIIAGLFSRRKVAAETDREKANAEKASADAAEVLARAALTLIEPYKEQVATFQEQVSGLRTEVANLRVANDDLRAELGIMRMENTELRTELRGAKEDLGVLRRLERATLVEQTKTSAILQSTLGIDVPTTPASAAERTRAEDYEPTGRAR